jgi:hypothetical protein
LKYTKKATAVAGLFQINELRALWPVREESGLNSELNKIPGAVP